MSQKSSAFAKILAYGLPMNIRSTLALFVVVLILAVAGCGFLPFYAEGQKFEPGRASELVRGSSTKNDVLGLFGEPLDRSRADLSKARWWGYHYTYLGNLGIERADLQVFFKGDILEDYQLQIQQSRY